MSRLPKFGNGEVYLPSQREIRQACEKIQKGWTSEEREKRKIQKPQLLMCSNIHYLYAIEEEEWDSQDQ